MLESISGKSRSAVLNIVRMKLEKEQSSYDEAEKDMGLAEKRYALAVFSLHVSTITRVLRLPATT